MSAPAESIAADYNAPGEGRVIPRAARRRRLLFIASAILAAAAALPFDGHISRAVAGIKLGGDLKRELEALQQFGGISSLILFGIIVLLLDRANARRLADLAAAMISSALAVTITKMLVGRPRPKYDDPFTFCMPWNTYPVDGPPDALLNKVEIHAWQLGAARHHELWSMPSSHTAAAVAFAVFIVRVYPKLRPLAVGMAILVGVCRVLMRAHYPSDVLVAAAIAFAVSTIVLDFKVGERVATLFSRKSPAAPAM